MNTGRIGDQSKEVGTGGHRIPKTGGLGGRLGMIDEITIHSRVLREPRGDGADHETECAEGIMGLGLTGLLILEEGRRMEEWAEWMNVLKVDPEEVLL